MKNHVNLSSSYSDNIQFKYFLRLFLVKTNTASSKKSVTIPQKMAKPTKDPKQNQQIIMIVLLLAAVLLAFELLRGRNASKKLAKEQAKNESNADTTKPKLKPETVADSIARVYAPVAFRKEQLKFERVNNAYKLKGDSIRKLYAEKKLDLNTLNIYIRAFKKEKTLEVWARDKQNEQYVLLKTYPFCKSSGKLGPKLKNGDKQIPEGFYKIDKFNPNSKFHLSLGLNYPNKVDKKIGDSTNLGADIFVHGACETVSSIPITDDKMRELYIMAVDAKAAGQKNISINIFPTHLTDKNYKSLQIHYQDEPKTLKFWASLKTGYQAFEKCKKLPTIVLTNKGEYVCDSECE